jgi:hypothetical protein
MPFRLPRKNLAASSGLAPVTKPNVPDWERPAEWLPLPEVVEGDNKFVGLHYITKHTNSIDLHVSGFDVDLEVDWGDGTIETITNADRPENIITHTYDYDTIPDVLGEGKQVVVTVNDPIGNITTYKAEDDNSKEARSDRNWLDIKIAGVGVNKLVFSSCVMLERFQFIGENSIKMFDYSFDYCSKLQVFSGDTSKVEWFTRAFYRSGLKVTPNLDFSSAINLEYMFSYCKDLVIANEINAPLVNDAEWLYGECRNLVWVEKLTLPLCANFRHGFRYNESLEKINQDVLDFSSMQDIRECFYFSDKVKVLPEFTLPDNVYAASMFFGCKNVSEIKFTNNFTPSYADQMFAACGIKQIPSNITFPANSDFRYLFSQAQIEGEIVFDCKGVTNLQGAFRFMPNVTKITLINAGSCTNFYGCFQGSTSLKEVSIDSTASATDMSYMFEESAIKEIPAMQTANVTKFSRFAEDCTELEKVLMTDLSSATITEYMFYNCTELKEIPAFTTSAQLTNIKNMFNNAGIINIPGFDTSNVTNASWFLPAKVEEVGAFDLQKVTSTSYVPQFPDSVRVIGIYNLKTSINIASAYLSEPEIINLFNNLIDLTGGSSQNVSLKSGTLARIAQTTKDIALNKNWTITG